jgi:hypothetical protein
VVFFKGLYTSKKAGRFLFLLSPKKFYKIT